MEAREKTISFLRLLDEKNPFMSSEEKKETQSFTGSSDIFNESSSVGVKEPSVLGPEEKAYTKEEKEYANQLLKKDLDLSHEEISHYAILMDEIDFSPIKVILSVVEGLPEYVDFMRKTLLSHKNGALPPALLEYVNKIKDVYLQVARKSLM